MIPTTPYLIRAIYEWCTDQGFTPHLLVDTSVAGVEVPWHLVENDRIVLNIEPSAVRSLELANDWLMFSARFSGQAMEVIVPVPAVRAIFARENGLGCAFEATPETEHRESETQEETVIAPEGEQGADTPVENAGELADKDDKGKKGGKSGKPNLKLV